MLCVFRRCPSAASLSSPDAPGLSRGSFVLKCFLMVPPELLAKKPPLPSRNSDSTCSPFIWLFFPRRRFLTLPPFGDPAFPRIAFGPKESQRRYRFQSFWPLRYDNLFRSNRITYPFWVPPSFCFLFAPFVPSRFAPPHSLGHDVRFPPDSLFALPPLRHRLPLGTLALLIRS